MTTTRFALFFPGALGDFLCWLPTLAALRASTDAQLLVVARGAARELLAMADAQVVSIDRAEIADLFHDRSALQPATRRLFAGVTRVLSWSGATEPVVAARLVDLCGSDVALFPFRGMRGSEHAVDYYARCAGVQPVRDIQPWLRLERAWAAEYVAQHHLEQRSWLLLHAGSGSAKKNWNGFGALSAVWRQHDPAVELRGAADEVNPPLDADATLTGASLSRVAALLQRAPLYCGNDSGISHLAAAVGARGLALFGNSDAQQWAPRGAGIRVLTADPVCDHLCAEPGICIHRLPLDRVTAALAQLGSDTVKPVC